MLPPGPDCALCPRLAELRHRLRADEPAWHNAPVPTIGPPTARLLIVGLAPGLKGANRTGIPFTGDASGRVLFSALRRARLLESDGVDGLRGVAITNAVRCVPPGNRPAAAEIAACRPFLAAEIARMTALAAVLTLGGLAHASTLRALGRRPADIPFAHGASGEIDGVTVVASYHCSRINTNTGRLTEAMLDDVFRRVNVALGNAAGQTVVQT